MAILNLRNLSASLHQALRERAARNGRSMEAEAKAILTEVCEPPKRTTAEQLQALVLQAFGGRLPTGVVERFLQERHLDWAER